MLDWLALGNAIAGGGVAMTIADEPMPEKRVRPASAKQAVIIIHGMGEQHPMDTVRTFVRTMWEFDPEVARGTGLGRTEVWSRLDARTGSLELRRITTRASRPGGAYPRGARTDFYELFWADLTAGSTWDQFTGWVRYLLFRRWRDVPRDVRSAWIALWVVTLLLSAIAFIAGLPEAAWKAHAPLWLPRWVLVALVGLGGAVISRFATRSFGRVVRYTRAEPDNLAARAAVRQRGLELLEALHEDESYARIVVVGHSLGSILAYDLLSYLWAGREKARSVAAGTAAFDALKASEAAAAALAADQDNATLVAAYRTAQSELRRALGDPARSDSARWIISDLVTIGSSLTHAEFLLATDLKDFRRRAEERELATAPPYRERLDKRTQFLAKRYGLIPPDIVEPGLFSFPSSTNPDLWQMHQGAVFAGVRWSNIFDPAQRIYQGDLISGPLADLFGPAVEDIDLRALRGQSMRFSHTRYWAETAPEEQLKKLRAVLNLRDL